MDTVECEDCGDVLDIEDSVEYDGSTLCYGCEWRRNYEDETFRNGGGLPDMEQR